jgi:TonB family protein
VIPVASSSPQNPGSTSRRTAFGRSATRRPLVVRKQSRRGAARARIAVRTQRRPTLLQLAFDPLARANRTPRRRLVRFSIALLGSLVLHIVAFEVGVAWRTKTTGTTREEVRIEMRQRPPPPPPEKVPPPAPQEKPARPPPKLAKIPPLPPPPKDTPKPVRVVGLSMESTTEGGSGPAFAVGNTRQGETPERAVAPKDVSPAPSSVPESGVRGPGRSNQIASHIPVAGVKYELPKRRHPAHPPFPPTLKSQGIEGDVTVLLSISAQGKVTKVTILKESPYPEFNESARLAALAEDFDPATRDGVAMSYTLSFTYRFRLEDE